LTLAIELDQLVADNIVCISAFLYATDIIKQPYLKHLDALLFYAASDSNRFALMNVKEKKESPE